MREPDTRLRTYLKAFFADTFTRMSGPLSVPFAALALWVSSYWQKVLWACLAVVSAGFASYRVWRNERKAAYEQIAANHAEIVEVLSMKEGQLAAATKELASFKAKVDISLRMDGEPPAQFITLNTSVPMMVSRVEYMTTNDATIGAEDVSLSGEKIKIPLNRTLVTQLWNTPRYDRNNYDHSGPAKIGIALSINNKSYHLILPIHMSSHAQVTAQGTVMHIKITGQKSFIGM